MFTQEMLDAYKKRKGDRNLYQQEFLGLMRARGIERSASGDVVDGSCLLYSEEKPQQCHRRLVAGYFRKRGPTSLSNIFRKHLNSTKKNATGLPRPDTSARRN